MCYFYISQTSISLHHCLPKSFLKFIGKGTKINMNDNIDPKRQRVSCRISNSVLQYLESRGYNTDAIVADLPYVKSHLKDPYNWIDGDAMRTIWKRPCGCLPSPSLC